METRDFERMIETMLTGLAFVVLLLPLIALYRLWGLISPPDD
jgi:hypothetical protein